MNVCIACYAMHRTFPIHLHDADRIVYTAACTNMNTVILMQPVTPSI